MTYQLTQGNTILRLADNAHIPPAEGNTDYQAYIAWLSEGNTPEPAPKPKPAPEPEPALEPEPAPVLTTEQKPEASGLTVRRKGFNRASKITLQN